MSHSPFTDALLQPKINSERSITLPYDPHRVNAELINVQAGGGGAVSQRGFAKRVGRWELNQKQPRKEMQSSNQRRSSRSARRAAGLFLSDAKANGGNRAEQLVLMLLFPLKSGTSCELADLWVKQNCLHPYEA